MREIAEAEARGLLARRTVCEYDGGWDVVKAQPDTKVLTAGLLDEDGIGTRLQLKLLFRRSVKTKILKYVFSVFKCTPYGAEPLYQLEITQSPKPLKDQHERSHEHFGDGRELGRAEWDKWDYDQVLAYFCTQANIRFLTPPPHPEHFELR
ncbi:hypothetical protein [Pseudoduganella violacea]|uniref:Uncharacterized protein n=1 Tax=Pseudoduganella violacea TaxID=1715466 RepID=A0A7W5B947_9BURK|nr:hypothetical protein [Pseudoduganella violacea]MBB3118847.1 hypothetical protein [Pseudoduganella violacea]